MKIFLPLFFLALTVSAQIVQPGAGGGGGATASTSLTDSANLVRNNASNTFSTGTQDLSGATHTLPALKGLAASKPATCTQGEQYFATDATAGQNLYFCTATNTWTQQVAGSSGSAGRVLLESHTASTSAELDFTTRNATGQSGATFQSDFDQYEVEVMDFLPVTNAVVATFQFSTNGGSSYDTTTGHYDWLALFYIFSAQAPTGDNSAGGIVIGQAVWNSVVDGGVNSSIKIFNPLGTTSYPRVHFNTSAGSTNNSLNPDQQVGSGRFKQTTGANAFRVLFSSGNIASGIVRVYGVAK